MITQNGGKGIRQYLFSSDKMSIYRELKWVGRDKVGVGEGATGY